MSVIATSEDFAFVDRLLASWASWGRAFGIPRCSQPSIRYSSGRDSMPHTLSLSDDEFSAVDKAVAGLHPDFRAVLLLHYCQHPGATRTRKAAMQGISLRYYNVLLHQAQLDVIQALGAMLYELQSL